MPLRAIERYLTEILLAAVLLSATALGPAIGPRNVYVSDVLSWVNSFGTASGPAVVPTSRGNATVTCDVGRSCQPS